MLNPILQFRQSSFISEKPGYFPEKLKILTSFNDHSVDIFFWNFARVSFLPMSTKRCSGFFLV